MEPGGAGPRLGSTLINPYRPVLEVELKVRAALDMILILLATIFLLVRDASAAVAGDEVAALPGWTDSLPSKQ